MRSIIELFIRNGGFVTFVLVEALCFYLIVSFNAQQSDVWANTSMLVGGSVLEQRRKATRYIGLSETVDSLQWENAALRAELANLKLLQINLLDTTYYVSIDSVRRIKTSQMFTTIPCMAVSNSISGASNWLTINRGTKDGILPNCGVITRDGIVGLVRYVDQDFSLVMSVLHRQSKISASLKGQLGSLVWEGNDPSMMTLNDIPKDIQPVLGDSVLTSGFSAMFPGGHLIGKVAEINLPKGSNFYALKVKLTHNMAKTNDVYVVRNLYQLQRDTLEKKQRMNSLIIPNIWRFLGMVAAQVLVLRQLTEAVGSYFNVMIYPLFILLLPIQIATSVAVLLGFTIGMTIDLFYDSIGVHASAGAFAGYARSIVLSAFEPKGGFSGKEPILAPAHFGWQTFSQAAGLFFLLHLFWYFSVEQFTLVYFGTISLKTLVSWLLSMIFVIIYGFLFNPKA